MDTCSRLEEPGGVGWKDVNVGRLRTTTSGRRLISSRRAGVRSDLWPRSLACAIRCCGGGWSSEGPDWSRRQRRGAPQRRRRCRRRTTRRRSRRPWLSSARVQFREGGSTLNLVFRAPPPPPVLCEEAPQFAVREASTQPDRIDPVRQVFSGDPDRDRATQASRREADGFGIDCVAHKDWEDRQNEHLESRSLKNNCTMHPQISTPGTRRRSHRSRFLSSRAAPCVAPGQCFGACN